MRVVPKSFRRGWDLHKFQQFNSTSQCGFRRDALVKADSFNELVADREYRIERSHRVLKDHRDLIAANLSHAPLVQGQQIDTPEEHAS